MTVNHRTTGDRVGVLGSGDVGKTLAEGFAGRGWDAVIGTRTPGDLAVWRDELLLGDAADAGDTGDTQGSLSVGSFADAAEHGDVAVLAVRGTAVEDVLDLAGHDAFAGALVLDATNPLDFSGEGPPGLFVGTTGSLGECVQRLLPDATVVKCFNTVSHSQMVDPAFGTGTPTSFVCGDDADAKARADAILRDFGWPGGFDVGDITASRWLEALVPLWVRTGSVLDTYDHAITVIE
jgi:hypothetical protein